MCGIGGLQGTTGSVVTGVMRTCRHLTRRRALCQEGEMQLVCSFEIQKFIPQWVLANNLEACLCIQTKQAEIPLRECWSHNRHRDPTCFGIRALNFSEGNWDSERQQKSPSLQRAAEGRVKEWLSPPFPKTCCLHAQKLWHSVTCTNPFFPLLYIHVLYLRLSTPQSNRYDCISNEVLRGFGMLVNSPSSHTGLINPGRYLRVLSGNWAGTECTCRGAVPSRAGNPVTSSRGVTEDGWLVLGPQPRRKIT